jgi:hypothetical protein
MAKVHVLDGHDGSYRVVLHALMPSGNNAAGHPWQTCWINAGRNVSSMPVGPGPGQILQSELNSVEAGTVIEFTASLRAGTATTLAGLVAMANLEIAAQLAEAQKVYEHYGRTTGTVE